MLRGRFLEDPGHFLHSKPQFMDELTIGDLWKDRSPYTFETYYLVEEAIIDNSIQVLTLLFIND